MSATKQSSSRPDSLPSLLKSIKASSSSNLAIPDDIDDPNSTAYSQLLSLTTQSLDDLRSQPAALSSATSSLESQLSTLCSKHVSSFVRVHSASSSLPDTLDKLDVQLENLIEYALPTLSNAAQQFPQQVESSIVVRDRARNLLTQYDTSLKDLLDIPQILMTCAKANHPIEALQLGTHMAKLARSDDENGHKNVTIKALKRECWTHLARLREDLLRGLGARGVRLPAARRFVSLLQRLRDIDEAARTDEEDEAREPSKLAISNSAICLSFLRSRWILVEEVGTHDDSIDPSSVLPEQISSWRDLVGETCSIAMALFGDKEDKSDVPTQDKKNDQSKDELSPLSLISSFGYRSVDKLEQLLTRAITKIDGDRGSLRDAFETLATLHTQLSYSAASLSRQGLDFSVISGTRNVFERQALQLWTSGIRSNIQKFENILNNNAVVSVKDLIGSEDAQKILDNVSLDNVQASEDWSSQVAQFPALTSLANGFLDIYEAFISFAPLSIDKDVLRSFDFAVGDLLAQLLESFRKAENDLSSTSTNIILAPLIKDVRDEEYGLSNRRKHEATMAVAAKFLIALSGSLIPAIRNSLLNLFQQQGLAMQASLDTEMKNALVWANEMHQKWQNGEQGRRSKVEQKEKDRLAAAEEERKRIEQEQNQLREEEEERKRLAEEKRIREEEENRKRLEEQKKRLEEERLKEEKRKQEEESRRRKEEQKRLEEEARRLEEEKTKRAKEAERKRIAEEEEKKRRLADEEKKKRLAEEEEKKRLAKEAEKKRLAEEEEKKRLAEEEKKQLAEEEEKKRLAEEAEKKRLAEEEEKKRFAEEEEKKRLAEEGEKKRLAEEEAKKKRVAEEEQKKREAEEEEKKRAAEEEKSKGDEEEERRRLEPEKQEKDEEESKSQEETSKKGTEGDVPEVDAGKADSYESQPETLKNHQNDDQNVVLAEQASESENVGEKAVPAVDAGEETKRAEGIEPLAQESSQKVSITSKDDSEHQKDVDSSEKKLDEENDEQKQKQPSKAGNKLAEKLRKRQEERERAAATAAAAAAASDPKQ